MSDAALSQTNLQDGAMGEARALLALAGASTPENNVAPTLMAPFTALNYVAHERWAWANYKSVILGFAGAASKSATQGGPVRILEIGGGRDPLFTPQEAAAAGLELTVNDIDAGELAMAPPEFARALFDIAGDLGPGAKRGHYDLVVSQMVFEHVRDVPRAWANVHELLAPGGVALAFFPTLYAPPYVLNQIMPEAMSAALLRVFFPQRNDKVQPKFPAFYDHCRGSQERLAPMFAKAGYAESLVVPFWTHGYFRHIPVLREIDAAVQNLARRRNWRWLTTYAFAVARK